MIVKVKELFRLAGCVMAGSAFPAKDLTGHRRILIPGYKAVWAMNGLLAFHAVDQIADGTWVGQPFTAEEIAESLVLICPRCNSEWPEGCSCHPGDFGSPRVLLGGYPLSYFEPARDREAEKARDQHKVDLDFLTETFGTMPNLNWVIDAAGGNVSEAAFATRWAMDVKLPVLALLDNAASMPRVTLNDILKGIESLGLPELLDPYGQPLKKLHQAQRLLHAAWIAASSLAKKNRAKK
jgi:hypothetical protein